jgi:glutamate formiminotransferase/formiminotetrahydrofolate cyclodeaminase
LVVENRLEQVLADRNAKRETPNAPTGSADLPVSSPEFQEASAPAEAPLRAMVEEFVNAVAAPTPTPGGGSVAALAGALAAGLGEMVCGISLKRKSLSVHYPELEAARLRLAGQRTRLMEAVDRDAQSYGAVMRAFKLPESTEAEQASRDQAIEAASKRASLVPLETAELAAAVARDLASLAGITISQAASDLRAASDLAEAARQGGIENVRANLPGVRDEFWLRDIEARLQKLRTAD